MTQRTAKTWILGGLLALLAAFSFVRHRPPVLPLPAPVASTAPTPPAPVDAPAAAVVDDGLVDVDGQFRFSGEHYVVSTDGTGVVAELPTHERLGLALEEIRMGSTVVAGGGAAVVSCDRDAKTFSYRRGSVEERYQLRAREFEQDFVLSELPPGRGDIVVTETLRSDGRTSPENTPSRSLMVAYPGGQNFTISRAAAIDAAGRRLELDLTYADGRVRMTVPAAWVETAALPIVVDPVVGGQILVALPQGTQYQDLAGGPAGWVAVWHDGFNTSWNVYAAPISSSGAVGSQVIVNSGANGYNAAIAYSAFLNKYLVVWIDNINFTNNTVAGRFLDGNGALSGVKFTVGTYASDVRLTAVAADASGSFLVAAQNGSQIDGAVVSSTGTVSARPAIQTTGAFNVPIMVAFSNGEYLVVWNQSGTVKGRGLSAAGALLTAVTSIPTAATANLTGITGGNNQFLVLWNDASTSPNVLARAVQADSAASLNFATAPITVGAGCYDGVPVWSPISSLWQLSLRPTDRSLQAATLTPAGAVSARTQIIPPSTSYAYHAAGVTAANDILVLYVPDTTFQIQYPRILAQRYNVAPVPPPATPTITSVVAGNQIVSLTWSASSGATSYKLFRSTTSGVFSATPTATTTGTSYNDTAVTNGVTYFYVVKSSNLVGDSAASAQVQATPQALPPPTPTGLTAGAGNAQVTLSWAASAGATSYGIRRSTSSGGTYTTIATGVTTTSFTNTGLSNTVKYWFKVYAVNSFGQSGDSTAASATPMSTVPAAPTLTAAPGNGRATLTWTAPVGATQYRVKRSTDRGVTYSLIATVTGTSYVNTGLTNGNVYYYVVSALDYLGEGPDSAFESVMPVPPLPATPGGLAAVAGNSVVSLSWTAVSGATGYTLSRSDHGEPYSVVIAGVTTTSYVDAGLQNGTAYSYVVQASNLGGTSAMSTPVSATPSASSAIAYAMLVVGNTTLGAGDAAIKARLQALGYTPVVVSDLGADANEAVGMRLVVISSTVAINNITGKFTRAAVPVVNCDPDTMGDLGMTGQFLNTDFGTSAGQGSIAMNAATAAHALSAGQTGSPVVLSPANSLTWAKPAAAAVKIATLTTDLSRVTIFGYESGAAMMSGPAPARRVGFFLGDTSAANWTAPGQALFNAAVQWAVSSPVGAPLAVNSTRGTNSITLSWTAPPGALTYIVLRSTSATGTFSPIASGLSQTEFTDAGLSSGATYYYRVQAVTAQGIVSVAVSTSAATTTATETVYNVGFLGPRYIRAFRPNTTAPDFWNIGEYRAVVYTRTGTTYAVATGYTGDWSLAPFTVTGFTQAHKPITLAKNGDQCTLTANTAESNKDDESYWELTFTVKVGGVVKAARSCLVFVTNRASIRVQFHFPQGPKGKPGQTLRNWPLTGTGNQFFAQDVASDSPPSKFRDNERRLFVNWLTAQTHYITKQAGVNLYYSFDQGPLKYQEHDWFDASGTLKFLDRDENSPAAQIKTEAALHRTQVDIWVVKKTVFPDEENALGATIPNLPQAGCSNLIFLNDGYDQQAGVTLAHEIIHALNNRPEHVKKWDDVVGDINVVKYTMCAKGTFDESVTAQATSLQNPLNIYLMRPWLVQTTLDGWASRLTSQECNTAHYTLMWTHPSYYKLVLD